MHKKLFSSTVLFLFLPSLCLAIDVVKVNEKDALFTAFDKTSLIISTKYVGWLADWKWAGATVAATHTTQKTYSQNSSGNTQVSPLTGPSINPDRTFNSIYQESQFNANITNLGINFDGTITPAPLPDKQLNWSYKWNKSINIADAIGFGIEFVLDLNSASFASPAQPPVLLAGNIGWRWQTPDGQVIEVTFTPPLAKIYFERGQVNTIRAMFFESVIKGTEKSTMTVKVSNKVEISGPDILNYDTENTQSWHKDILLPLASPVDLSFLNSNDIPAGKRGVIVRKKDQLLFADGTPAKFWGANMIAYALFATPDEQIKQHAKRIAQLGFNLIRIHHHDSVWVRPNIFLDPSNNTLTLSATSFQKLDLWIESLKAEGVYLWLDLHVGRTFTENDEIQYFDDIAKGAATKVNGFNYYNISIQSAMQAFNTAYLNHTNQYTGIPYKNDPAVIAVLITNENDLTHHFGHLLLDVDDVHPIHHQMFLDDVDQFSTTWELDPTQVAATWKPGPSKIYLNDAEHRFNVKMLADLGLKSLIATTSSWGKTSLFSLPALTDGSIIDAHTYGRDGELSLNPRSNPGFLSWIGAAQVTGYPLSVTEWNIEPFPARDRFTSSLFTASIASLQGWDAMMLYGYSQDTLNPPEPTTDEIRYETASNYSTYNDPAITGLMPAAALLYRQGHVKLADNTYELKLSSGDFYGNFYNPDSSKTIRTLLETSRLTIAIPSTRELPWLNDHIITNSSATPVTDPDKDYTPAGKNYVVSDTGELKRDWEHGIHTINTAKSQIASGTIGGEKIRLGKVEFKIQTTQAVVAVQSLENKPIEQSNKIFITLMARSKPFSDNKLPFISEPVLGTILITAPAGLNLYTADNSGNLKMQPSTTYIGGRYQISVTAENSFHWAVLQP